MTAAELIELLLGVDPDTEVRIAEQPSWPFEYAIAGVVPVEVIIDTYIGPEEGTILYIVEGAQLAYLPDAAFQAIGWR